MKVLFLPMTSLVLNGQDIIDTDPIWVRNVLNKIRRYVVEKDYSIVLQADFSDIQAGILSPTEVDEFLHKVVKDIFLTINNNDMDKKYHKSTDAIIDIFVADAKDSIWKLPNPRLAYRIKDRFGCNLSKCLMVTSKFNDEEFVEVTGIKSVNLEEFIK